MSCQVEPLRRSGRPRASTTGMMRYAQGGKGLGRGRGKQPEWSGLVRQENIHVPAHHICSGFETDQIAEQCVQGKRSRGRCPARGQRSEERRVGKEGDSTCRSGWSQSHEKTKKNNKRK